MTNSLIEVMPLVSLDGKPVNKGKPGEITQRILKRYRANLRKYCAVPVRAVSSQGRSACSCGKLTRRKFCVFAGGGDQAAKFPYALLKHSSTTRTD